MSTWRYAQQGQTLGPVETPALLELLRSGALPAETL
ncbi:MAG: domain 2, partial [Verrucomicrobiota bacterium]